ncbi:MAG: hypothetical protein FJ009_05205 [Chloroflexi bacterium]|nr:hypothetical protein [Chloroflexota bacterium]
MNFSMRWRNARGNTRGRNKLDGITEPTDMFSRHKFSSRSVLVTVALILSVVAGCAPATPAPAPTSPPTPLLTGEGRRGEVTATPTVPLSPTATLTPTATPTPTRTAAQARAAALAPFASFSWRADGDAITLTDAKGARVATLDAEKGGISWTGDFATTLNPLLSTEAGRQQVVKLLQTLPNAHFLAYADSRPGFPPYAVTLTPDNKGVQIVQGFAGTTGYEWHKEAKALAATSEEGKAMYFWDKTKSSWEQCIIVKDGAKENAIFGADWGRWIWDKNVKYPDNWQYAAEANEILTAMKAHTDFYPAAVRDSLPWLFNMKNTDISNVSYFAWIDRQITDKSFADKLRAVNDPLFRLMAVNTNEKITISNRNQFNIVTGIEITDDEYSGKIARLMHEMTHARKLAISSSVYREVIAWFNEWMMMRLTWDPPKGTFEYKADSMKKLRLLSPYLNIKDYLK